MAACAGILLAWLAVRCAAQDVEGPSCAAAAVRKSGPSHVLFWKLRRTGSTTLCAQLTAYAESTGRSYLSDSTTRPSDSAPRGGGAAAVLCQSRPPHSWLAQHRGTALQLVMLRDPAQMRPDGRWGSHARRAPDDPMMLPARAWSLYYFNLNNPKASQRVPGMANTWAEAGFAAELNGTAPRDLEAARMQLSLTIPTAPRAVAWFQAYFGDGAGLAARREAAPPAAPQRAAPAARAAGAAPRPRNLSAGGGARSLLDGARAGPMDATRAGNRSAFDHFGGANFVYDWAAPNGRPGTIADALREVEAEGAKIKCLIFEKMDESIALVQLYLGDVARPEIASTRHKCFRTPRAPFESWPAEVHEWYRTAPLAVAAKKLYAAFESRFEAQIDAVGRDKHDSAVRCLRSMQKEKGASEKGPGRFKMITEKEASRGLSGRVWLVSHGGVGSEYLRGLLDPDEAKKNNANSPLFLSKEPVGPKARPMRSVLAHLGRPVDVGPKLAIYLYGGAALSVTSQIGRHPDNAAKLHNDEAYPAIYNVSDLFAIDSEDPFGIATQFQNFARDRTAYPVVLLRSDAISTKVLEELAAVVSSYTGAPTRLASYVKSERASTALFTPADALRVKTLYSALEGIFEGQPALAVWWPTRHSEVRAIGAVEHYGDQVAQLQRASVSAEKHGCWPPAFDALTMRFKHFMQLGEYSIYNVRLAGNVAYLAAVHVPGATATMAYSGKLESPANEGANEGPPSAKSFTRPFPADGNLTACLHARGAARTGFEDPRAFEWRGLPFVVMNGAFLEGIRSMYLLNVTSGGVARLWTAKKTAGVQNAKTHQAALEKACGSTTRVRHERGGAAWAEKRGHAPQSDAAPTAQPAPEVQCIQKNWIPYVDRGALRFIYSISNTAISAVLELSDAASGRCDVVHGSPELAADAGDGLAVAGGTALLQWAHPFFVGVGHTRNASRLNVNGYRFAYRPVTVIIDVERFTISVSDPFSFPNPTSSLATPWRGKNKDVQYPYHLAWDAEGANVVVGVEFQDRYSVSFLFSVFEFAKLLPLRGNTSKKNTSKKKPRNLPIRVRLQGAGFEDSTPATGDFDARAAKAQISAPAALKPAAFKPASSAAHAAASKTAAPRKPAVKWRVGHG